MGNGSYTSFVEGTEGTSIVQDFEVLDKDTHEVMELLPNLAQNLQEDLKELQGAEEDLKEFASDVERMKKLVKAHQNQETVHQQDFENAKNQGKQAIEEAFELISDVHSSAQEFAKGTEKALEDLREEKRALNDF